MSEVSRPAEEAGEEVEGIMRAAALSALLVLFEAFVAVLIVDAAAFRLREGVIGFGDLDEFLRGRFIATAEMKSVSIDYVRRVRVIERRFRIWGGTGTQGSG